VAENYARVNVELAGEPSAPAQALLPLPA